MGFSRQEYWSGVPLPSPFWALRVIICSNQLGIDLWPHVSGYLEEVGTYFSVVHTVFYYRSSLHAAHKPHCNVLHRHSIEFFLFTTVRDLCVLCSVALAATDSLRPSGLYPARLLCLWGFSRQEYWNGLPCPPPRDLPDLGIEPVSFMSPERAGRFFTISITWASLVAQTVKNTSAVGETWV